MSNQKFRLDIALVLLACIVGVVFNSLTWNRVGAMRDAAVAIAASERLQTNITSGSRTYSVISVRFDGESYQDFVARHLQGVSVFSSETVK